VQIGMTDDYPETGELGRFTVARQWQLKDAAIYERRISVILVMFESPQKVSGPHDKLVC
jgi:hypothetical protein